MIRPLSPIQLSAFVFSVPHAISQFEPFKNELDYKTMHFTWSHLMFSWLGESEHNEITYKQLIEWFMVTLLDKTPDIYAKICATDCDFIKVEAALMEFLEVLYPEKDSYFYAQNS